MVNSNSYSGWVQIDLLLFHAKLFLELHIMMGLTTENSINPVLNQIPLLLQYILVKCAMLISKYTGKPNFAFSKHLP